ncbi:MAG: L-glutamate gamma-semialdehyde dehydrogenase, partial [Proteobacteria bacterium]|nr:L-glutamate gamma-semialdehyde dehydrogenase [Pseudomonadota bacterium]
MSFKLTYATMFSPPEELHGAYESALAQVRAELGRSHALYIDGRDVPGAASIDAFNPARQPQLLGRFGKANLEQMRAAVGAARMARAAWAE